MSDLADVRALLAGLFYPSEEDAPLEAAVLSGADVASAVADAHPGVEPMPLDAFFAAPSAGGFAAAFPDNVAGFARLRAWLTEHTTELAAFRAGDARVVAGKLAGGDVLVVTTCVVQT